MILKFKEIAKILFVFLLSFILVQFLSSEIFLGNTPIVRQNLGEYFAMRTKLLLLATKTQINGLFQNNSSANNNVAQTSNKSEQQILNSMANIPFQQVAKGTYAKTTEDTVMEVVKLNEIESKKYTFTLNGQKMTVTVPADSNLGESEIKKQLEGM